MDAQEVSARIYELVNSISDAVNSDDFEKAATLSQELSADIIEAARILTSDSAPEIKEQLRADLTPLVPHLEESLSFLKEQHDEVRSELLKLSKGSKGLNQYRTVRRSR